MADQQENRWKVYGALAAGASLFIVTLLDYKSTLDLRSNPNARPDAYTGTQGRAAEHRIKQLEEWRFNSVVEYTRQLGKSEARINQLYRRVEELESDISRLERKHHADD